jgi:integrase/recombinase XerD
MIEHFHTYLEKEDKSLNTVRSYIQHVNGYLKWFDESKGVEFKKLHRENIKDYLAYIKTVKNMKPASINAKVGALLKFNEFLVDEGIQSDIVITRKENVKVQQQYASLAKIELSDVEKLRQLLLDNEKSKRNHALVTVLAYMGLRISEALNIQMNDFNLVSRELVVREGKGEKTRIVFINDKVASAMNEWIKERETVDSDYLFVSNRGGRMDRTVVNKLLQRYSSIVGKEITPHDLRHFFCSYALSKGMSVHEVANQAGHSNIHTTLLYTNPSKSEILNKMNML